MSLLKGIADIAGGVGGLVVGMRGNKATNEQKQAADLAKFQANVGKQMVNTYQPLIDQTNQALTNPATDPFFQAIQQWQQQMINSDLMERMNAAQIAQNRAQAVGGRGWVTNPERRDESFLRSIAAQNANTHAQAADKAVNYIGGLGQHYNQGASTLSASMGPIQSGGSNLMNFGNMQQRANQANAGMLGEAINSGVNVFKGAYDSWQNRNTGGGGQWETPPIPMARPNPAAVTQQRNF